MKAFVALGLIILAAAEAQHLHSLEEPRFVPRVLYVYDAEFNVTSGVLGLSSQASKAAIKAQVSIYAKTERRHILKIEKVYTSGSLKGVQSWDGPVPMTRDKDLESRIAEPTEFTLINGQVISYTLSTRDNIESRKIRKSILRSLQMYVPEEEIKRTAKGDVPITYNTTEATEFGSHSTHYLIAVSPYAEFPADQDVYNITRSDNFEAELYPAHHQHSNFRKQGCSEVCRKDWRNNEYAAGCPVGFETHRGPMKTSFTHEQHLSRAGGAMNPEIVRATETHLAQMYDQDMELLVQFQMWRKTYSSQGRIEDPPQQQSYENLDDFEDEINADEINAICHESTSKDAFDAARDLLEEVSRIVVNGDVGDEKSSQVGEKVVLLKKALARLPARDLEEFARKNVLKKSDVRRERSAEKKVARQIWLDILPLIGSQESVTFIVEYVKNLDNNLMIWEAKEILETLPQNIEKPTKRNVEELMSLLTDSAFSGKTKLYNVLHSAVHLTVARLAGKMCGDVALVRSEPRQRSSWFDNYLLALSSAQEPGSAQVAPIRCPKKLVDDWVQTIASELEKTDSKAEIAVYLETLAHVGTPEVLPIITKYAYGLGVFAEHHTPGFVDFVKSVSLYSLHNVVGKHPEEVLQIVIPVFFNRTETAKVRNAAFGVLIRCQPPLDVLERVAHRSWDEPSKDVASFVVSTFETFGNSSLPCMQLTSQRIKKVMPHVMRKGFGIQHAKNIHWSFFDDLRSLGIEKRFEYTPSNASFVPSSIYHSLAYSTDSLRDVIMQMSLNIEGLSQRQIFDYIDQKILGIDSADTIPDSVFSGSKLAERVPDEMRFTLYKRIFYCHSFYYFDKTFFVSQIKPFFDYWEAYMKRNAYDINGHLVKTMLPSAYHTSAIARTLPYPVEFEMAQPLVLALKVKSIKRDSKLNDFKLYVRPSFYFTKLYTNQLKNLGDCKEVGVYFENKFAVSMPFEVKFKVDMEPSEHKISLEASYKLPELMKRVFSHSSESGTYASKWSLKALPSSKERIPIKTIPEPFKFERKVNVVGLPPLHVQIHTEDIQILGRKLPSTPTEALVFVLRKILNAGWRHKSYNISIEEDSSVWPRDTEVTFRVNYNRSHVGVDDLQKAQEYASKEEDWSKDLNPSDVNRNKNPREFIDQGRNTGAHLAREPHIARMLEVEVSTSPRRGSAYVHLWYNQTYSGSLHVAHVDAALIPRRESRPHVISMESIMAFLDRDNEFKYEPSTEHLAVFMVGLRAHRDRITFPWEKIDIVSKGTLMHEDPRDVLEHELAARVGDEHFLPETHAQCRRDVAEGQPLSTDCLKALRESTLFNHLEMSVLWQKNIPDILKTASRKVDLYLKHFLFPHLNITEESYAADQVWVSANYIDKFTDEPLLDLTIYKPSETLHFGRVPTFKIQPFSNVYGLLESASMEATNNTYPVTCVMMKNYVRTYDQKSYPFWADSCEYVLTTHCTKDKNFAIMTKAIDRRTGSKSITAFIGKNKLIMTPPSDMTYSVKFADTDYPVGNSPLLFNKETDEIYIFTEAARNDVHLRVIARKAGINMMYDGVNIKVQIDPKYKGEMCGLCSEFDGDELREFRGLDRCLYSYHLDFAYSNILKREGSCEKSRMTGEKLCDNPDEYENHHAPKQSW